MSGALFAALLLALPAAAQAACTEKDQENKVNQLGALMMPLMQRDAARAQRIGEAMQGAMMQQGDAACTTLDKLIADAK